MNTLPKTADLAKGKWPGILSALGFDEKLIARKNIPCPMCGGKDRFRFTNKDDAGLWVCSQCGGGDGLSLLQSINGWDFKTACREVDAIIGNVEVFKRPVVTEAERMGAVEALWNTGTPVVFGDPVHRYLTGRKIGFVGAFSDIRCVERVRFAGRDLSMMAALLRDNRGHPVNLHRTFIEKGRKADIESARMMMAGAMPDLSCAIRLGPVREHIGIAEGIETAAAAAKMFGLPVWSVVNTTLMEKWTPPESVRRVTIFADNDANFAGLRAAYRLANRLSTHKDINVSVDVRVPAEMGTDFADELENAA